MKYQVYVTATGDVVATFASIEDAKAAIDDYNEISGTYGFLDYDIKVLSDEKEK